MKNVKTPAFYVLDAAHGWKSYVNLLHVPYSGWHLAYVVLGAAVAPSLHLDRLIGTLLAFFLAVGIAAHALDELQGRPLKTGIPRRTLLGMAILSLGGAVVLGTAAALTISMWLFPFVAFGAFIAVAYNLGLWNSRFHTDVWFAFAWGAFPVLTSYWINALSFSAVPVLLGLGCFTLSLAQRSLSTQVRTLRRKTISVQGKMEMVDGSVERISLSGMLQAPERALALLSIAIPLLAASLLAFRLMQP